MPDKYSSRSRMR